MKILILLQIICFCAYRSVVVAAYPEGTNSTQELRLLNVESELHQEIRDSHVITADCFSAMAMDQIVRSFAAKSKIDFVFRGVHPRVFIPKTSNYLAFLWYATDKGKPALLCRLNFEGKVDKTTLGRAERNSNELPDTILAAEELNVQNGVQQSVKSLMTPERVDSLVHSFVLQQRINFDFTKVKTRVMSIPKSRQYLVDVLYFQDFAKPAFRCTVDFEGKVLEWKVAEARG